MESARVGFTEKLSRWLRGCVLFALIAAVTGGVFNQVPQGQAGGKPSGKSQGGDKKESADKKSPSDTPGKPPAADKFQLPPGAILVLVESIKDAYPKMWLVAPKKWQEMQDRIRELENQLKADKKPPGVCKLSGKVDGDYAYLQADFKFTTQGTQRTVLLGLKGANLTDEGDLDGQTPMLDHGPDGFAVLVDNPKGQLENPKGHRLTLNLKLAVKRTGTPGGGSERGFELGLPGAAVTTLSLELPNAVQEIRCNDHLEKRQGSLRQGRWELTAGKIKNLQLSWKEPVSIPGTGPLLTAEGQITVKIDENQVLTTAELQLGDLRGQAREWQLLLPAQAKVEVKTLGSEFPEIVPLDAKNPLTIIRLKEPSSERVQVVIQVSQPRPLAGPRLPIGPFTLLGAFEHQGDIVVKAAPEAIRGLRLVYHRQSGTYQREIPANLKGSEVVSLFHFAKLPGKGVAKNAGAPLELELKAEKGQVETQVEHILRLSPSADGWQVDLTTKIKGKSLGTGVDYVDVQLPRARPEAVAVLSFSTGFPGGVSWSGMYFAAQKNWPVLVPAEFVCQGEVGPTPELQAPDALRRARITLNRPDAKEFTVVLTGKYALPSAARQASLELPWPLGTLDRGGKVTVVVDEKLELLVRQQESDEPVPGRHQQVSLMDLAPHRAELAWRDYRPEFPVASVTDITVHQRNAHVRHELRLPFTPRPGPDGNRKSKSPSGPLEFRVPADVRSFSVSPAGRLFSYSAERGRAWINPPEEGKTGDPLVVDYDFVLPPIEEPVPNQAGRMSRSFSVPLVWPDEATRIDAKVRVWCGPGILPILLQADDVWRDRGTERVPPRDSLPGLVLHGSGLKLPLQLRLLEGGPKLPAVVCDRGLMQVTIYEDGGQYYRVRFLVQKLNADHLDVKLPAPALSLIQEISLNKERINNWLPLEGDSTVVRIPVQPSLYSQQVILDLKYKLPSSVTAGELVWQTLLHPPDFRDEVFLGRIRWHVTVPSGVLAFVSEGGSQVDYSWEFRKGLLTPEAAATGEDLERWLTGEPGELAPASGDPMTQAGLVFWRTSLEPLRIWRCHWLAWLLVCSGLVLAVGLGLGLSSLSRFMFWLLVVLMVLAVMAAGLLWPSLLPPVVYGSQPGLVVLVVILGIQWLLQERYRRQVVFMPGFTRLQSNSSLVRSGSGNKPREASTVDSPAASPSTGSGVTKER